MTTNGNDTLKPRPHSRPYGIGETVADEHPLFIHELDAEMYGKHAQGKYPEQVSVWDLCSPYEGKHRK
jgi:hypothetical protein